MHEETSATGRPGNPEEDREGDYERERGEGSRTRTPATTRPGNPEEDEERQWAGALGGLMHEGASYEETGQPGGRRRETTGGSAGRAHARGR